MDIPDLKGPATLHALRCVALWRDASIFLEHMQIIVNGYTGCVATRHRALRCVAIFINRTVFYF